MLTLSQTEQIVDRFDNMFWDGWTVVIVNPKIDGYTKMAGVYHNDKWSVKRTVAPNAKGLYEIPRRYLNVRRTA